MTVMVSRVKGRTELNAFIDLPYRLHRDDPSWIPPLRSEVKKTLSQKNPFWNHADYAFFLARREGEIVGRIASVIDFDHIRFHDEMVGFWGFFECVNDSEIAEALFATVENFLADRGIAVSRGPLNPSTNEECGLLIKGFDTPPYIMMTHNPPYYASLIEENGYSKVKDLLAYHSEVTADPVKRLERLAARVLKHEPTLVCRPINLKKFHEELLAVQEIYNAAWEKNWGFVPMSDDEIVYMARRLKPLVFPPLLRLAFLDGEPAGFIMTLPNFNEILHGLNGRLTPINMVKLLLRSRHITSLRLITMGIKEKFRKRGIDAVLYHQGLQAGLAAGYTEAEYSWILEENTIMQKAVRLMNGELYKTYRIYEKVIREAA